MAQFTRTDGTPVIVAENDVIRIRDPYPEESTQTTARCRIDYPGLQFVMEDTSLVVPAVKAQNAHIGQLTLPNGRPVWFNGQVSRGPTRLFSTSHPEARSALFIEKKVQYVRQTPEAVRDALKASGGTVLPLPSSGFVASIRNLITSFTANTPEEWD